MAQISTATSNFANLTQAYIEQTVEEYLRTNYPHADPANATFFPWPRGHNALTVAEFDKLAASQTALTEGTPPTSQALAIQSTSITARQLGFTVTLTDLAMLEAQSNLVEESINHLSDQMADSIDQYVRDIVTAGASVVYANGTARSAVSATLSATLVRQMAARLDNLKVRRFDDGYYHSIISPFQAYDLQSDTAAGGWIDVFKYTNSRPLLANEIGEFAGFRFQVTANAKVFSTAGAGSKDVHAGLFFGKQAYAVSFLQPVEGTFVGPGGDQSDPLRQKAIAGVKAAPAASLLTNAGTKLVRLETETTTIS